MNRQSNFSHQLMDLSGNFHNVIFCCAQGKWGSGMNRRCSMSLIKMELSKDTMPWA